MFTGTLKPYQVEAVARMVEKKRMLVAYEMGLGKTPMTLAAIEELRSTKELVAPTLVLCLASLKYQWQKEVAKFTDRTALVIDGTPKQRQEQYSQISKHGYVVMNYEQVVNDWDIIQKMPFGAIVCDEATAIKGFRAKRAKKVKELAKHVPIKFALTGTPIENGRPEELYSIMQFVDNAVLGRFDLFDKTFIVRNHFGGVDRYRNLPVLHKTLSTASVRKSQKDEDVKPYLPNAIYREPLLIPLDSKAQKVYNYISEDLLQLLVEARETFGSGFNLAAHYGQMSNPDDPMNELRGQIMSRITAMRMLCSNPVVLQHSARLADEGLGGSGYAQGLSPMLEDLTKRPKLDATVKYLKEHLDIDESYKAVVFASYLGAVKELHTALKEAGITAVEYTGKMNAKEKEDAKVLFQTTDNVRVFISSDAGGYGVDLPQANLLVNYDQPWSAGLAVQRNGRINRASSTWPTITIQDILIKESIEQRQHDTLKQKSNIANAILDGEGINSRGGVDLTVGSLIDFLSAKLI
jgi:SNF2 family DNA or RNA helicase